MYRSYITKVDNVARKILWDINDQKCCSRHIFSEYKNYPMNVLNTFRNTVAISYLPSSHEKLLFSKKSLDVMYLPFIVEGVNVKVFRGNRV